MKKELTNISAAVSLLARMRAGLPTFVSFNVSNQCNEQCLMCSLWRTPSAELSLPEMEGIFNDLKRFGFQVMEISGGEPLLRKDIFEILELVDRTGFLFTLSTNGTVLGDEVVGNLNRYRRLLQLAVSIDSLDRARYRRLRGADMLPRVLNNLESALKRKPAFPVKINFTMSRFNYQETLRMLEYAGDLGAFLSVFPVNQGAGFLHRSSEQELAPDDRERREMAELFRKLAGLRRRGAPLWDFSRFYERAAEYVLGRPMGECGAGALYLDLHADGMVAPCIELAAFADLRREAIKDVYQRLEGRRSGIQTCSAASPCCYTCTYHLSDAASHPAQYVLETMKVRTLAAVSTVQRRRGAEKRRRKGQPVHERSGR